MTRLQLPVEMFDPHLAGGGLTSMHSETKGFQDPATQKPVALAAEFDQSGLNVVLTATRLAGQSTQGYASYNEITQGNEKEHGETKGAVGSLGDHKVTLEEKKDVSVQAIAAAIKKNGPEIGS